MPYPDARYLGEECEIGTTFRRADQEPELTIGSSTVIRYLATRESTNWRYGLYRWDMRPHASGESAHVHKTMSESFFILSGMVRLFNGEHWIYAAAGDLLYIPEGGVHARAALGDSAFEEAWEQGRAMTFEQAVAYDLESDEVSPA